ncbi:hypothetical protein TTHERM_00310580 (macronuclear) [Tetrahymena thermophila SB210]|uniref:Uncharacterized protein n=1 Tax=Tetrahymena thermophila (strain SB210) TaxID=312017 RepID=I7M2N6_TETTS|nr:hypothetical protein TTHERM_00310580 [Tetrahymena thermophila SB210]EAS00887.3 hypothetical protein TTHERM_00310580 [Tetrahymena thermophila SB210]|eukprot:XP_001021133.3 hypothetical protein TTHERM_00310580 [Tetrahymena thermophila SB210]
MSISNNFNEQFQEDETILEENIAYKQRQQQRQLLLQKVQDSMNTIKNKEYSEFIKLKEYVFGLYLFFENDWKGFSEEADLEIGNCYKFCINKLNIFKNILRSFFGYMKNKGDDIVIECLDSFQKPIQKVKKQFIRFSERHPANNKSMQVLFEYSRYGRQFEYFLNFYAIDWLIKSKVKDVVPHLLSIFFLLRCFQTPQLKDLLKVYKKTKKITLPRKVRKSKTDSKLNIKEEIKCEEATSMQQIDSYNLSTDSYNGAEDSKIATYNNINESHSTTSSHSTNYQQNIYYSLFPLKQNSLENNQHFSSCQKNDLQENIEYLSTEQINSNQLFLSRNNSQYQVQSNANNCENHSEIDYLNNMLDF